MSTYAEVPKSLDLPEQMLICIGKLIAEWANCESCFYVVFFCLTGRPNGNADVIWASVQSTRRRMEIISDLIRYEVGLDPELASSLQKCIARFVPITALRNYYCHSIYHADANGMMSRVDNWHIPQVPADPTQIIETKSKPVSKATINEMCCTIDRCMELADDVFKLLHKLRDALQLQHVVLPPLPNQYQA
ncbi:hypothetical protein [Bradyrhizobium sp. 76]|uniref:hypothetical protein n=1 Tax=Bradyrhizobium sp. 76 TaxID=2782680 RepID=UPI001FF8CAA7|nr:hypothetical protein [Bradyrhizobium sp. 76]